MVTPTILQWALVSLVSALPSAGPVAADDQSGWKHVRLVGHQLQFEPLPPFTIGRAPPAPKAAPDSLLVAHFGADRLDNVMVIPGVPTEALAFESRPAAEQGGLRSLRLGAGGTTVILGADMTDIRAVGRFIPGAPSSRWQVEARQVRAIWPEGYTLKSTSADAKWAFEYHGLEARDGAMIFLRGPFQGAAIPAPPHLVAKGQTLVAQDLGAATSWMELGYRRDGASWRQRHFWVTVAPGTVVLVTTQAPEAVAKQVAKDGGSIAATLEWMPAATSAGGR